MATFKEDAERAMAGRRGISDSCKLALASKSAEQLQALFLEVSQTFEANLAKAQREILLERQALAETGAIELFKRYQAEMWPKGMVTVEEGNIKTETPTIITADDYARGLWSFSVRGKPLKTGVAKISPSVSLSFNYPDWINRFASGRVVSGHEMSAGVKQAFITVSVHTGYPGGRYVKEKHLEPGDDSRPNERIFIVYEDERYNNDINIAFARYMDHFQGGSGVAYENFRDGFWGGQPSSSLKQGPVIVEHNEEAAGIVKELVYKDYEWRKEQRRFPAQLEEDGRKRIAMNTPKKRTVLDLFKKG